MEAEMANAPAKVPTNLERKSDRETVVTGTINGPAHLIFQAWTNPELLKRWWVTKSCGISFVSCETDARVGGGYRFVFSHPAAEQPMAFFGKYTDVKPNSRLVWTNEESAEGGVTTVTFEEKAGKTHVVVHELYPSKAALDETVAAGNLNDMGEQFAQLEEVLGTLARA